MPPRANRKPTRGWVSPLPRGKERSRHHTCNPQVPSKLPSIRVASRNSPTCMSARLSRGHLNHRRMSTRRTVAGTASTRIVERSETVAGGHHQPDGEPSVMSATHAREQPPTMRHQASLGASLRPDTRRIERRRPLQRSGRSRAFAGQRGHRFPVDVPVGHVRSLARSLRTVVGLLRPSVPLCPAPPQVSKPSKMER